MLPLPVDDPVSKITILLAAALFAPVLARGIRLPGIILLILAGVLLGPYGFNVLARDGNLEILAQMGLLYVMFVAGAEVDLYQFLQNHKRTATFGALTFLIPLVMGTLGGVYYLGFSWLVAILFASMLSSHTLLAYPVISDLGLSHKESVIIGLGGTIVTNAGTMVVLAVIAAMWASDLTAGFWARLAVSLAVVGPGILLVVPRIGRWSLRKIGIEGGTQMLFVLVIFYACGYLAHLLGLLPIIGAFFAGLALNRLIPENSTLMNRLRVFGNRFFIPLFLISVGMAIDWRMARDATAWQVAVAMIVIVMLSKLLAAKLIQREYGFTASEGWTLYSLSLAQEATTVAAVFVAHQAGIFGDSVLGGTVLMVLVTCVVAPRLAERFGRRVAIEEASLLKPLRGGPDRIIVPVSYDLTSSSLMELACVLHKDERAEGPVHAVKVVTDAGEGDTQVTAAERLLGSCLALGAATDTPINPVIRLDMNIADGISNAARELRARTIVLGWRGPAQAGDQLFGSTFEQILQKCPQRVLASRLVQRAAMTKRIVLALPPVARFNHQFTANLEMVKLLASEFSATVHVVLSPNPELRKRIEKAGPRVPTTFEDITAWDQGRALLNKLKLGSNDLLVLFSARPGDIQWRPWLNRLPAQLMQRFSRTSMIVVYPSKTPAEPESSPESRPDASLLVSSIPEDGGVFVPLEDKPFKEAVRHMLDETFRENREAAAGMHASLMAIATEYAPEIAPGVALLHTPSTELAKTHVLVGVSRSGLKLPGASEPIRLLFVILGSKHQPAIGDAVLKKSVDMEGFAVFRSENQPGLAHVHLLAAIAQIARDPAHVEALVNASSRQEVVQMLEGFTKPDADSGARE